MPDTGRNGELVRPPEPLEEKANKPGGVRFVRLLLAIAVGRPAGRWLLKTAPALFSAGGWTMARRDPIFSVKGLVVGGPPGHRVQSWKQIITGGADAHGL